MLKVVENYTLRRGLAVNTSLWSCLGVSLYGRLGVRLGVHSSAKTGRALVVPAPSRAVARGAMRGAA